MSSRDTIFSKIRTALGEVKDKADYPDYDPAVLHAKPRLEGTPREAFTRNFITVGGEVMRDVTELAAFLQQQGNTRGYCDPALMDEVGNALAAAGLTVETEYDRSRYEDYQFGITRATGAIAESGSLILDDAHTSDRLAALSPWVHIGVLRESEIHRTIPEAMAALGPSRNILWATGPSKTADVEGILIEGVHGPGEQVALFI
ncbi:LUD domain-containing protein [Luteolibacter arcticus]|uniref:LUD domain-containing protein n=1 Tax=Luteolibacter arcticus TaxID=1581411 RepID=A0ABT3GD93_9BACT|nr:LUD domain-containing protein [Luteolibacter arcticus]MCW1921600.1 LUD domain-containing protein [Luteolibacter arcticus]